MLFRSVRVLSDYTYRYAKGDRARGLAYYNYGPFHRLWKKHPDFDVTRLAYVREVTRIYMILEAAQYTI